LSAKQSGNSSGSTKPKSSKTSAKAKQAGSSKSASGSKVNNASKNNTKNNTKNNAKNKQPILTGEIRREVFGFLLVILAIALLIAIAKPGNAVVTKAVSAVCWALFGVGAFLLPFLVAAWGASFFADQQMASNRRRLTIGVLIVYLAALSLIAVNTSGAAADPSVVFDYNKLTSHGGYIGAAFAWAALSLFGYAISMVIFFAAVVVGAILIGFSLVSLARRLNQLFSREVEAEPEQMRSASAYDLGDNMAKVRSSQRPGAMDTPTARLASESRVLEEYFDEPLPEENVVIPEVLEAEIIDDPDYAANFDFDDDFADSSSIGVTQRITGREQMKADVLVDTDSSADADGKLASANNSEGLSTKTPATAPATAPVNEPEYVLPNMKLLKVSQSRAASKSADAELRAVAGELQQTLQQFQIDAQVVGWTAGPTVTLYKLALGEGVRVARITSLADDIALALAASSVRIFSPIPGTSLVGVEVPNAERSMVLLGDVLPSAPSGALQVAIGKDVEGANIAANLASMPHLLIGGTTGSGKSVAINSMIMSVLMRTTPDEVRMILIDPKMVELTRYNDVPHLYVPVVTEPAKAASALAWAVIEMEDRLKTFMEAGVKNINEYNEQTKKTREVAIKQAEKQYAKDMAKYEKDVEKIAAFAAAGEVAGTAATVGVEVGVELGAGVVPGAEVEAGAVAVPWVGDRAEPSEPSEPGEEYGFLASEALDYFGDFDDEDDFVDRGNENGEGGDYSEDSESDDYYEELSFDEEMQRDELGELSELGLASSVGVAEAAVSDLPPKPELTIPANLAEELPLVLIVIDELADLMLVAGKDVEASITRLSQLARAAGLHLIIATQRPSTNVITGVIKANIVNRIAFNVGSGIDSRVILDTTGAETLLGNGDMLFAKPEYGRPARIQGCYVSEAEINDVAEFWRKQAKPEYREEILATAVAGLSSYQAGGSYDDSAGDDPLVWDAADIVVTTQMGSTSTIQRRLKVGYMRAGRIMDNLEQKGIVGPPNGSKPREVLVDDVLELESIRALDRFV
jgi:S-DNA-T family DNA segregation ATPase FtsK/SpoIIIE